MFSDLYGDDFSLVELVYFETKAGAMSRSDIWYESEQTARFVTYISQHGLASEDD